MEDEELGRINARLEEVRASLRRLKQEEGDLLQAKEVRTNTLRQEHKDKFKADLLKQTDFPWSAQMDTILQQVFHLQEFRHNQREIIHCIMSRTNCFVIIPTGGGKSLCYQLAALLRPGFTLVITPLISLMQDQCHELRNLGISCEMIYSDTSKTTYEDTLNSMRLPPSSASGEFGAGGDRVKLVYVSPEKLVKSKRLLSVLEECYKSGSLDHIVVDEAHCCSTWGHDFRPDYKKLAVCKVLFPETPLVALTATASPKVQRDVENILNITQCITFSSSVNRPNLYYEVLSKAASNADVNHQIADYIRQTCARLDPPQKPIGIVYCLSRKETEDLASFLQKEGFSAMPYHASLDAQSRDDVHRLWRKEEIHIIVATIAFGLGINMPNVRFVIHHTISKSIDSYYQESGRAGRDGELAHCCAFYRPSDLGKLSSMIYYQPNALEKLYEMAQFAASGTECRKSQILVYFGEPPRRNQDICCDACAKNQEEGDESEFPQANLLECVKSLRPLLEFLRKSEKSVTLLKLAQVWKGLSRKSLQIPDNCPTAPGLDLLQCEHVIVHLIIDGYLQFQFHNTAYSTLTYVVADDSFLSMGTVALELRFSHTIALPEAEKKAKKRKEPTTRSERKPKKSKPNPTPKPSVVPEVILLSDDEC